MMSLYNIVKNLAEITVTTHRLRKQYNFLKKISNSALKMKLIQLVIRN
jgi:hypothetical protein